jgi:hypothetical protein
MADKPKVKQSRFARWRDKRRDRRDRRRAGLENRVRDMRDRQSHTTGSNR